MNANDMQFFMDTMNDYYNGMIDEDTMRTKLRRFNVILSQEIEKQDDAE
jgi:hypothetical protein